MSVLINYYNFNTVHVEILFIQDIWYCLDVFMDFWKVEMNK